MGIIPCAEPCQHQTDGYCCLSGCSSVCSLISDCPYFTEKSADQADGVTKPLDAGQFDGFGTGGHLF